MQSRDASKAETHQNKRPREKKKKKGTFLFHIHAAEKSRHAAGDWAGHEELLIMTKDFSHDRFFFFFSLLPPLDCLRTTEGDFSSSAAAMEPMDTKAFCAFSRAREFSCGGELCRERRRCRGRGFEMSFRFRWKPRDPTQTPG